MDTYFATPIRSVSSQENAANPGQIKSLTGQKSLKGSINASTNAMQDASLRKKLMQWPGISTPSNSARRKLGNVSNTPGLKSTPQQHQKPKALGAHHKEESFVKPLDFGSTPESCKKKPSALASLNAAIAAKATLPTVYEEIENYYPLSKKQHREERDPMPAMPFAIFDETAMSLMVHSDEEDNCESQKENRLMTLDELCEMF